MFFVRMAIDADDGPPRLVRLSLNAPVVALEDLPTGPARAALWVSDAAGRPRVRVVVRCEHVADSLVFGPDEGSAATESESLLVEGAISFLEAMGFLLDDDALADARDARAALRARAALQDLLGPGSNEPPKPEPAPVRGDTALRAVVLTKFRATSGPPSGFAGAAAPLAPAGSEPDGPEIELDTPADAMPPSALQAGAMPPERAHGEAGPDATRFRRALGRVRLLKRSTVPDATPRPGWLQRLLSAF